MRLARPWSLELDYTHEMMMALLMRPNQGWPRSVLQIELGDGNNYMATSRRRFDVILVDGFDAKGRAGKLRTLPFYRLSRVRLNDGGMLVTNLLSRRKRAKANADPIWNVSVADYPSWRTLAAQICE